MLAAVRPMGQVVERLYHYLHECMSLICWAGVWLERIYHCFGSLRYKSFRISVTFWLYHLLKILEDLD
jgi:hypothetical protein